MKRLENKPPIYNVTLNNFVRKMEQLLRSPKLIQKIVSQGRRFIEKNHSLINLGKKLEKYYLDSHQALLDRNYFQPVFFRQKNQDQRRFYSLQRIVKLQGQKISMLNNANLALVEQKHRLFNTIKNLRQKISMLNNANLALVEQKHRLFNTIKNLRQKISRLRRILIIFKKYKKFNQAMINKLKALHKNQKTLLSRLVDKCKDYIYKTR